MIAAVLVSLLAVAGFAFALWQLSILKQANKIITAATTGVESLLDRELDDDAKESAVRTQGLKLIAGGGGLAWRLLLALAAAAAPLYLADAIGLISVSESLAMLLRIDFIIIVSVAAIILARIVRSRRQPAEALAADEPHQQYQAVDRFFHAVAFSSPVVLKSSSWLEDKLNKQLSDTTYNQPIFVTSLARGGTTALLNALVDTPEVATHLYRDMPFLTSPILWNKLSGRQRAVKRRKRAHGDGLEIDLDTPEAFEEVLWLMFWAEKYHDNAIEIWRECDRNDEAERFIRRHMSKIIQARRNAQNSDSGFPDRYCSKNNANIARLELLPKIFPGCKIVVPVRRPDAHSASLLRQHVNFNALQSQDSFVRRYMRDIGHFEFGLNHKPIAFPGFTPDAYAPDGADYWLHYWVQAFKHIRQHADKCLFVTQDELRKSPRETLLHLSEQLNISAQQLDFNSYFRTSEDPVPDVTFSKSLLDEAMDLYHELSQLSDRNTPVDRRIYREETTDYSIAGRD